MQHIANPVNYDKVILIHNGALGDFFLVWPLAMALSRAFPRSVLLWAGPFDRLAWLSPLSFTPCPGPLRLALDTLYGAPEWPAALAGHLVVWPVIDKAPPVPDSPLKWVLPAMAPEDAAGCAPSPGRHVRETYLAGLARRGVAVPQDWHSTFTSLFAANRRPGDTVLLFPGAGHALKRWPLVKFLELAECVEAMGLRPVFALGPAELESGLDLAGRERVTPADPRELQAVLLTARAVVGGDCGPMHLAGMLGVPGVSVFGPTGFGQWGPPGMTGVSLGLGCSPCTRTCALLACPAPRCLGDLPVERVAQALALGQNKTGFQGPGFPESRLCQKEEG